MAWQKVRRRILLAVGWALVAAVVVGAVLLVWRGPWWLDADHLKGNGPMPGQAALATGFRTAVVQLLAVLGAGIALLFTASNYRLTRRGQVTDRFVKALERLGSDQMYVRIGGVIALEQIVHDAPDQATHATQVLNAFIRERAPRTAPKLLPPSIPPRLPSKPAADVQQALTALTRPQSRHHVNPDQHPDLAALHLTGAWLGGVDLTDAWLVGAHFTRAWLHKADLTRGQLDGVDLTDAQLGGANLTRSQLGGANLTRAWLYGADLTDARLDGANLTDARLDGANLTDAWLDGADLTRAWLYGADLRRAVSLTVEQVVSARPGSSTMLPSEIAEDPQVVARIREVDKEELKI